jgi:hypothetical protein
LIVHFLNSEKSEKVKCFDSNRAGATTRRTATICTNGAADQTDFPLFAVHRFSLALTCTMAFNTDPVCSVCDEVDFRLCAAFCWRVGGFLTPFLLGARGQLKA